MNFGFDWLEPPEGAPLTVGATLHDLMASWMDRSRCTNAPIDQPTTVGGSKKHGGPDLGPYRSPKQWRALGVDGIGIADQAPDRTLDGPSALSHDPGWRRRIQGFPTRGSL